MRILRLKATICDIKPAIWRRLEVPADLTLHGLHNCLQATFGWTDTHLHEFEIAGVSLAPPDPDSFEEHLDSRKQPLWELEGKVDGFTYTYDFGDGWEHKIEIEAWANAEEGVKYPRCTAGARHCPPEDCGGSGGYADLLEALADPAHEEHETMKEWVGSYFSPEQFSLSRANGVIRNVRTPAHKPGPGPWTKALEGPKKSAFQPEDRSMILDDLMLQFKTAGAAMTPELEKAVNELVDLRMGLLTGKTKKAPKKQKGK